ncbi:uncharacterized protein ASCRUDRAFT_7409 [Ascoidea rubescens DSM 1968]|uniref:Myb-like domain-containing protein n=1 Tax=Ascoidea rubescens DSM 1968 TaxID=1344418 RepID=A0A1D2VK03_9ASCO|nr:hypothetical protein ASCRUDRAFT_7409 [Ascoidea rubescens DSM 1968]ODV61952.1 hypothetical protein ASCRUDRAFT_7409 [Ascoidea rubescens DSM 1968]
MTDHIFDSSSHSKSFSSETTSFKNGLVSPISTSESPALNNLSDFNPKRKSLLSSENNFPINLNMNNSINNNNSTNNNIPANINTNVNSNANANTNSNSADNSTNSNANTNSINNNINNNINATNTTNTTTNNNSSNNNNNNNNNNNANANSTNPNNSYNPYLSPSQISNSESSSPPTNYYSNYNNSSTSRNTSATSSASFFNQNNANSNQLKAAATINSQNPNATPNDFNNLALSNRNNLINNINHSNSHNHDNNSNNNLLFNHSSTIVQGGNYPYNNQNISGSTPSFISSNPANPNGYQIPNIFQTNNNGQNYSGMNNQFNTSMPGAVGMAGGNMGNPQQMPEFNSRDLKILKTLLISGEKFKWKHILLTLSRNRNKKVTPSCCLKKSRELFGLPSESLEGDLGTSLTYAVNKNGWSSILTENQMRGSSGLPAANTAIHSSNTQMQMPGGVPGNIMAGFNDRNMQSNFSTYASTAW